MDNIFFINEQKVKDNTRISGNVDSKIISRLIIDCQYDHILPIVGSGIYNELKNQVKNGNLTDNNKTLLEDYIHPCLLKYIEYEAGEYLNFKFTNANVGIKNTDESVPLNTEDIYRITNKIKNKAESRAEAITKFLLANNDKYPLYLNPGSTIDTVRPVRNNYTCGILLDDYCDNCHGYNCCCGFTNIKTSSPR